MRREQRQDASSLQRRQRVHDEHVGLARLQGMRRRHLPARLIQLHQCARQGIGIVREEGPRLIGLELPGPRYRHLDETRSERREDPRHQQHDRAATVVVVAAEPERHHREVADRGPDRRCHGGHQDVAIGHVRELMGQDAAELALVQDLHDALGDRDLGVGGIPARGEGVGLGHVGHVDAGHGHAVGLRELTDDRVQPGLLCLGDLTRSGGTHRDRAGPPVHREVEPQAQHQGDEHARLAPDERTHDQEQPHEGGDQDPRLESIDARCHVTSLLVGPASHGGFDTTTGRVRRWTRYGFSPTKVARSARSAKGLGRMKMTTKATIATATTAVTSTGTRSGEPSSGSLKIICLGTAK